MGLQLTNQIAVFVTTIIILNHKRHFGGGGLRGTGPLTFSSVIIIVALYTTNKSGLKRVRNCVGELALRFETVASFYVCQPNHSYAVFMFSLHSDPTRAIVVAGVHH